MNDYTLEEHPQSLRSLQVPEHTVGTGVTLAEGAYLGEFSVSLVGHHHLLGVGRLRIFPVLGPAGEDK